MYEYFRTRASAVRYTSVRGPSRWPPIKKAESSGSHAPEGYTAKFQALSRPDTLARDTERFKHAGNAEYPDRKAEEGHGEKGGGCVMKTEEQRAPDLRLRRFRCWLLSCDGSPYCERCGTDLYDPDYIQYGKLDPLLRLYWRVYEWTQRPKYCGKPIGNCFDSRCTLRKDHDGECDDIPF